MRAHQTSVDEVALGLFVAEPLLANDLDLFEGEEPIPKSALCAEALEKWTKQLGDRLELRRRAVEF